MCILISWMITVDKHNSTYFKTKMKPVDVKSSTYTNFDAQINDKDSKFKDSDHVEISEYKNVLQRATLHTGLKKFL